MKLSKLSHPIILMLWLAAMPARGQNLPEMAINSPFRENLCPSPEMSRMIRNIVYPVNYSTGLVDITIPLYEITCGDIKLPITLSYHGSGVKLAEPSGWVGQGWTLNCVPMLSQLVHGENDELFGYKCEVQPGNVDKGYLYSLAFCSRDEQPDDYFFKLLDKQGEFMYVQQPKDTSMHYMCMPFQNVRIRLHGHHFQLTDDAGRRYRFDKETECVYGSKVTSRVWSPSCIVSSNGQDSISFSYANYMEDGHQCNDYITVIDRFSEHRGLLQRRDIYENSFNKTAATNMYPTPDYWMQSPTIYSRIYEGVKNEIHQLSYQCNDDGSLVNDWYPYGEMNKVIGEERNHRQMKASRITFPQGSVSFKVKPYGNTGTQGLSDIIVSDNAGKVVRHIELGYDFALGRIFLTKLRVTGEKGESTLCYQFKYWEGNLPAPGSKSIDYWGYYNGVDRPDSTTLVPYQRINVTRDTLLYLPDGIHPKGIFPTDDKFIWIGSPLSRECDEKYMQYGALKSITYPAGSMDVFEYEANRALDDSGKVRTVGGLRIKRITSYNGQKQCNVRSFEYGTDGNGVGYCPIGSGLEAYCIEQTKCYVASIGYTADANGEYFVPDINGLYITARHRTYFSNPVVTNTFSGGSAAVYDRVTEYNGTKEHNSGKTVYTYNVDKARNTPPMFSDAQRNRHTDWCNGLLLSKSVYETTGGSYRLVERKDNEYDTTSKDFGTGWCGEIWKRYVIEGPEQNRGSLEEENDIYRTSYTFGALLQKKTTHTLYDTNGEKHVSVKSMGYNDSQTSLLCKSETLSDDNSSLLTQYEYPMDRTVTVPYREMAERNLVVPISTTYNRDGRQMTVSTPYKEFTDGVFRPASQEVSYAKGDSPKVRLTFGYDSHGNKREVVKDKKERCVYLYGYNHQCLVAVIENASFSEVAARVDGGEDFINRLSGYSDSQALIDAINALRPSMSNWRITTYEHKPLVGVSAITTPDGITTCYDYDELGRLCRTYVIHDGRTETIRQYDYHYKTE